MSAITPLGIRLGFQPPAQMPVPLIPKPAQPPARSRRRKAGPAVVGFRGVRYIGARDVRRDGAR